MAYNEFDYDPTKHTLGAINTMLNAIGEEDIDSEEDIDDVLEATKARKKLMETKREVLSGGWDVNTDDNYVLPIDLNGYIPIPANVLQVTDITGDLIEKGHMLYSKSGQSTIFEEAQTVIVLWDLAFNDIPQALRNYITFKATKRFRDADIGADATQHGFTQEDERDAYMEARRSEATSTNASMLSPTYDINRG